MKVEVVLTEADIAQEFAEAMEARDLSEKFFFWFPRSASQWSELVNSTDFYGGLDATWAEIAAQASVLAAHFGKRVPVISFGSGNGSRDRVLINALKAAGCECSYFPVDSSQTLLEMACGDAEDEDLETVGIKADISSPVHLVYAADAADPPRLFIMSGNTLGAFDPLAEIRYVTQCMKPGDRLLVDGEIYDAERTMARRDNPDLRRFLSSLLSSVGISEEDGDIRFGLKRDDRHEGMHIVTRFFRANADLTATVSGEQFALQRGEDVGLNFQYTYSPETFRWLITERGGLTINSEFSSPDGRFLTLLCGR